MVRDQPSPDLLLCNHLVTVVTLLLNLLLWFGADGEERKGEAAVKKGAGEVAPWGIEKWWRAHVASPPEVPKYAEKAPAKVPGGGGRFSPRTIQQPR